MWGVGAPKPPVVQGLTVYSKQMLAHDNLLKLTVLDGCLVRHSIVKGKDISFSTNKVVLLLLLQKLTAIYENTKFILKCDWTLHR